MSTRRQYRLLRAGLHVLAVSAIASGCADPPALSCGEGTEAIDGTCVAIQPGQYRPTLVELQDLEGTLGFQGGMHLDELLYRESDRLLFGCGWTFTVNTAGNPQDME